MEYWIVKYLTTNLPNIYVILYMPSILYEISDQLKVIHCYKTNWSKSKMASIVRFKNGTILKGIGVIVVTASSVF